MSSHKILDIISTNKLHINVLGDLPEQYRNEATHNKDCFIGGSYALYVASHMLGLHWARLQYNDIDVYIADENDSIGGDIYQNILLPRDEGLLRKINIRTASLTIHMYDLECCQFFIYNGLVFGTEEAIQALETRKFTVRKEFMGCADTVIRVEKYRERGFYITTPKPDKILCLSYYGGSRGKYDNNIISYPRSFRDTLYNIFGINPWNDNKPVTLEQSFTWSKSDNCMLEHEKQAIKVARLIKKNAEYILSMDDVLKCRWKKVEGIPTVQENTFELTDVYINDNIIMLEFIIGYMMITYTIDKKQCTGYYTLNIIKPIDKPGKIRYWNTKLPYLGIAVEESGIYIRQ